MLDSRPVSPWQRCMLSTCSVLLFCGSVIYSDVSGVQITATNADENATAGLEAGGDEKTGNTQDCSVTSLVLVRQNARHLFEPRTPETEVAASSSEPAVVGPSLSELIVVQDECAGCLPLAAMLRPHRAENHLITATFAPSPDTGAC